MATRRTPGITVVADGRRFIDKRYLGVRIGRRVGAVAQEQAEERLEIETARVQCDLARKAHARPTFTDCTARYVAQSHAMPPLITMLPENPRSPYPVTGRNRDELFRLLPGHPARMVLFAVNAGLRDSNVCGLQWTWEVRVPELGRSVFVIPPEAFKTKRSHVVILNDAAWSIIESQRGKHPIWVFPYRGRRIGQMNNNGWQQARREAGLPLVRVHDLRHSFACRLRAAGVSAEDREALLGHANHSMAGHYASADVGRLPEQANLVLNRSGTQTVLRIADGRRTEVAEVRGAGTTICFCAPSS